MPATDLALELVRLDTVNPPGREEAAASLLGERLKAAGFDVAVHEHAPGRPSVVARLAGDKPALCMTGHLDTVPLGGAPWSVEAFGELRDGRLYGRGSSDMKGGVAAIVIEGGAGINLVPDRAEAGIDIRTVPGMTTDGILAQLRTAAGPEVAIEPILDLAPVATDPGDPFVEAVAEVAGSSGGGMAYGRPRPRLRDAAHGDLGSRRGRPGTPDRRVGVG